MNDFSSPASTDADARHSAAFQAQLQGRLSARCRDWQLQCVAETGSTNADLLTALNAPANDVDDTLRTRLQAWAPSTSWAQAARRFAPVVRQAQRQTAGRGRLGRSWRSSPGDSLLFSLGLVIPRAVSGLSGLSLALGTAVIRGLRRLDIAEPARLGLKWPNDILLDEAKLGGILIETAASSQHATAIVIGVGINLRGRPPTLSASALPDGLAGAAGVAASSVLRPPLPPAVLSSVLHPTSTRPATGQAMGADDGADDGPTAAADALAVAALALILDAMAEALERFTDDGFAPFRDDWWQMHRFAQRPVVVIDHEKEQMRGIAVGVDDWGRLLIDTAPSVGMSETRHATAGTDASGASAPARPAPLRCIDVTTPTVLAVNTGDVSLRGLPDPA